MPSLSPSLSLPLTSRLIFGYLPRKPFLFLVLPISLCYDRFNVNWTSNITGSLKKILHLRSQLACCKKEKAKNIAFKLISQRTLSIVLLVFGCTFFCGKWGVRIIEQQKFHTSPWVIEEKQQTDFGWLHCVISAMERRQLVYKSNEQFGCSPHSYNWHAIETINQYNKRNFILKRENV